MKTRAPWKLVSLAAAVLSSYAQQTHPPAGIFESSGDVGATPKSGAIEYNPASGEYRVTGGGANIWGAEDAFFFAWQRLSGDVTLSAEIRFVGRGVNPHRKAVLMIRQDLTAGSAYADAALHGDGLASLQFRSAAGADTEEIRSPVSSPTRLRIERRGNLLSMLAGRSAEELISSGPRTVEFADPVYVGIGVCSHDGGVLEAAKFLNVRLEQPGQGARLRYRSRITAYDITARSASEVHQADEVIEAPNWSRDAKPAQAGGRAGVRPHSSGGAGGGATGG